MKLADFDFEGVGTIEFNQKVQTLFKVSTKTTRRSLAQEDQELIEINPETLALTVFDFKMGDAENDSVAGIRIDQWNDEGIKFKMEFADPLAVSSGQNLDKLNVSLRKGAEQYFRTEDGKKLSKVLSEKGMGIAVKKQLPKHVSQAHLVKASGHAQNGLVSVAIV